MFFQLRGTHPHNDNAGTTAVQNVAVLVSEIESGFTHVPDVTRFLKDLAQRQHSGQGQHDFYSC